MLTACPHCGAGRPKGRGCTRCGWRPAARTRRRRRPDLGTNQWKQRSLAARQAHVAHHGLVCPGWPPTRHAPHPVPSISHLALHEADGPGSHPSRCHVLCRTENGRIGSPT